MNSLAADLLFALLISVVLMFATWLSSLPLKNAGVVDIAWSGGFTVLALLYYCVADGWVLRKILVALLVMSWSVRLALHLVHRLIKELPNEDARYKDMRASFGANANFKFFVFFEIQGLILAVLSAPFCVIAENSNSYFSPLEYAGATIFLIALTGEWLSDRQLKNFKSDKANHGEVCQVGLWHYSRHPNYFFEWLVWVAFFLIACAADYGIWTVVCPALMLFFLLKVSGVPLAEQQSLKSKGDKYRQYQKTTSVFFPWFRKEN